MRISRDTWAMELAQTTAKRSTCCRRSVGCVMLNAQGHVIATGYNGVAAGLPHCNEPKKVLNPALYSPSTDTWRTPEHWEAEHITEYPNACEGAKSPSGTNLDGCEAIHAEQNALLQCSNVNQIDTIYVTVSPCITCLKMLLNTSCKKIVFQEEYSHGRSKELWLQAGRVWEKF